MFWSRVRTLIVDDGIQLYFYSFQIYLFILAQFLSRQKFEYFDEMARQIKNNDVPFGGIQVILVTDVFQGGPCTSH